MCGISSRGFALGMGIETQDQGKQEGGRKFKMGVEWKDEDVPSSPESHSQRLAKVITLVVTTADGEFEHQTAFPLLPTQ